MASPSPRKPSVADTGLQFIETPNPHALKCVLVAGEGQDAERNGGTQSSAVGPTVPFRSAAQAQGHPLAEALFRVAGVTGVLVGMADGGRQGEKGRVGWFTVNKSAETSWSEVKKGIRAVVKQFAGAAASDRSTAPE